MTIDVHYSYGVPPTACNNRVDAKITSMKINSEGKRIDVISKHGAIIDASMNKGYSVKISLQSLAKGSTPEKNSFWFTTTAYGFSSGICVKNANVSIKGIEMGQAVEGLVQDVKWGSWPDTAQITYKVRWHLGQ